VNDVIKKLSPAQRKKVETRAAALITEEMTLQELRRARKLAQVCLAKTLGIAQKQISNIETRRDSCAHCGHPKYEAFRKDRHHACESLAWFDDLRRCLTRAASLLRSARVEPRATLVTSIFRVLRFSSHAFKLLPTSWISQLIASSSDIRTLFRRA
jgi:hypothetical protein